MEPQYNYLKGGPFREGFGELGIDVAGVLCLGIYMYQPETVRGTKQ